MILGILREGVLVRCSLQGRVSSLNYFWGADRWSPKGFCRDSQPDTGTKVLRLNQVKFLLTLLLLMANLPVQHIHFRQMRWIKGSRPILRQSLQSSIHLISSHDLVAWWIGDTSPSFSALSQNVTCLPKKDCG